MPALKRGRSRSRVSRVRALVTSRRTGNYKRLGSAWKSRKIARLSRQVSRITKTIETKEAQYSSGPNQGVEHNNVEYIQDSGGSAINPFKTTPGTSDPMVKNTGARIGDQITVKGLRLTGMFEGALGRSKVFFRLMLIKMSKGDACNRGTLFQGKSDNKMLDLINTERYSIVWQKKFTVSPPNPAPTTVNAAGEPVDQRPGITGTRIITAWIPGWKFGKGGILRYENGSDFQLKFFDYRFVIMAYDWYGTPQDVNTVGRINEFYSNIYYKDA